MKSLRLNFIALFICTLCVGFSFWPVRMGLSQSTPPDIIKENRTLKSDADSKQIGIANKVEELKKVVDALPESPKIVYKYKTRWRTRVDTVYYPQPDSTFVPEYNFYDIEDEPVIKRDTIIIIDTVYKKTFLQRLFKTKTKKNGLN